jgi:uncharacterized cupin superfamily protein
MAVKILNPLDVAKEEKKRTVLFNSRKAHSWLNYYSRPGDHDELHCHNADQLFMCLEGECTMSFPDGGKEVITPGMAALINGGTFYMLENTGDGPMILLGYRTGPLEKNMTIDYVTREDLNEPGRRQPMRNRFDDEAAAKAAAKA